MKKRKPFISIIITSNNHVKLLKRCIDSFINVKNAEIVIINNYFDDEDVLNATQKLINKYKNFNLIFYQSKQIISKNRARNLGIDFSNGSWIYYVEDFDYANEKFIKFFNNFKFNSSIHFYRVPIFSNYMKKEKISIFKTKYYSTNASSLIINEEWIKKIGLKWEDELVIDDAIPFINAIYNYKNVNYIYIPNLKTIYHNFDYEKKLVKYDSELKGLESTLNVLMYKKTWHRKQFAILLLYKFYKLVDKENKKSALKSIKLLLKKNKIFIFSYFFIGFKFWIKTFLFRWKTMF